MYIVTDANATALEVVPVRQDPITGYWRLTATTLTSSIMNCDELKICWFGSSIQTGGGLFLTEALFTDSLGGSLVSFLTDFSGVVRPWILQVYNSVWNGTVSIMQRLGSFTGTGVNTVIGFLSAIMRKDVTVPSDLGGTYDDATHSLQAILERGNSAWTTGAGGGSGGSMNYALKLVTGSTTETLMFNQQFLFGANGESRIIDVLQGSVTIYPTATLANSSEGGISQNIGEQIYQLTSEAVIVAQENNTIVTISGNVA
jgi:hypothetical protein